MKFSKKQDIAAHIKDAQHIGKIINTNVARYTMELVREHDSFNIASHDDCVIAEAVSMTSEGDFICVTIDSRRPSPLSYVTGNVCDLPATSIEAISHVLATVVQAFRVMQAEAVAA